MKLPEISLTPEQAQTRENLLLLHRQLNDNMACLEQLKLENPGFELMVDAFRNLMEVTARAACEAALSIEMVELHLSTLDRSSG